MKPQMRLAAGERLGPYEILAPSALEGMGEVYKARDTRIDRIVAISRSAVPLVANAHRTAAICANPCEAAPQYGVVRPELQP
jgi:hypothetical protein